MHDPNETTAGRYAAARRIYSEVKRTGENPLTLPQIQRVIDAHTAAERTDTPAPERDYGDELYLILKGTRERICVWQTENPNRSLVDSTGPVVRAIDRCGAQLASWSKHDRDDLLPDNSGPALYEGTIGEATAATLTIDLDERLTSVTLGQRVRVVAHQDAT